MSSWPSFALSAVGGALFIGGAARIAPAPHHSKPGHRTPTFAADVAPILYKNCVECHRPGEVAPFTLAGYESAKEWAPMCAKVVGSRIMPPWKATENYGHFVDERRLSDKDIETLQAWAAAGAPRGDAAEEPKPPKFASEWKLGEPDYVLTPDQKFSISADGRDVYRNFTMKLDTDTPIYVKAMDVRPGNNRVVHHVIVFLDDNGASKRLESATTDGQPGYTSFGGPGFLPSGSLGGWAPGLRSMKLPDGVAFKVAPHCTLVMQVHYHPDGKPETDRTKVALYVAKEPILHEMKLGWLVNPFLNIQAGDAHKEVSLDEPVPVDITAYGVLPHMHLLGKAMKAYAVLPDGKDVPLIEVKDWDFNWQMMYRFSQPIKLPKGSKIHVEAVYDNSANNPRNPNSPPKRVHWGEQTTDEMFLLVVGYTVDKR